MSNTWHHSKKVGKFKPRARTKWRVVTYRYVRRYPHDAIETRTYVNIMTPPAEYRRMLNRLWRVATKRETARHWEVRTTRPRSVWDYW